MTNLFTNNKDWPDGLLFCQNLAELRDAHSGAVKEFESKRPGGTDSAGSSDTGEKGVVEDSGQESSSSSGSESPYPDEVANIIYLDFAGHFRKMMSFLASETGSKNSEQNDEETKHQMAQADKFLDLTLKDVILNTEPITTLRPHHDRLEREGKVRLNLSKELGALDWPQPAAIRDDRDLGLLSWTRYLNISESSCFGRLAGALGAETRRFSERTCLRISQTLLFRAVFKHLLGSSFDPFAFGDKYEGPSLLPRYFDGFVSLPSGDDIGAYLLRTSTMETTWVSAIHNFGLAIEDVRNLYPEDIRGILFVPGYPNKDTLKAELFWQNQKKIDITVLYLLDLYELVRMWDDNSCLEYVTRRAHE